MIKKKGKEYTNISREEFLKWLKDSYIFLETVLNHRKGLYVQKVVVKDCDDYISCVISIVFGPLVIAYEYEAFDPHDPNWIYDTGSIYYDVELKFKKNENNDFMGINIEEDNSEVELFFDVGNAYGPKEAYYDLDELLCFDEKFADRSMTKVDMEEIDFSEESQSINTICKYAEEVGKPIHSVIIEALDCDAEAEYDNGMGSGFETPSGAIWGYDLRCVLREDNNCTYKKKLVKCEDSDEYDLYLTFECEPKRLFYYDLYEC